MAHPAFINFLQEFSALKSKVNNNPNSVVWMAGQSRDVQALAMNVYIAWQKLNTLLATAPSKGIDRVPRGFRGQFLDYESKWAEKIGKAFSDAIAKIIENMNEIPEMSREDEDQEPDRPDFNPRHEDAAELVGNMHWLADLYAQEDSDIGDEQRKGLQAWDWFEQTVGLDLEAIATRWKRIEPVFIPDHVANAYGASEAGSLSELLDQAVTAYVHGASAAAVAMCRALTELVLTKHYGCEGEDLENIIIFAEKQPRYYWMKKHKFQKKRKLANQVLHEYRRLTDESVVNWLAAIKELIEKVPNKGT